MVSAVCASLVSCATSPAGRSSTVSLVSYASAFFGPEKKAIEQKLISVFRGASIERVRESGRATTTIEVEKKDYLKALNVVLDAVESGRP